VIIDDRVVRLNWAHGRDDITMWNKICASCIQEFGLPGDKFEWHPSEEHMDFVFKDPRDALIFQLMWA
jgi:hypothetical protein